MQHISCITEKEVQKIAYVLMDIDDTLTTKGKLSVQAYTALSDLKKRHITVIPITGGPAGWCNLIARMWPVDGVIGESGALALYEEGGQLHHMVHPKAIRNTDPSLLAVQKVIQQRLPDARISKDQFCRLYDIAFSYGDEKPYLPVEHAKHIVKICNEMGVTARMSSIHVNVYAGSYDKVDMAIRFLSQRYGYDDAIDRQRVMYIGDSPNDESMFSHFPLSVGVANIRRYLHMIQDIPSYIAEKESGEGFSEIVQVVKEKGIGSNNFFTDTH